MTAPAISPWLHIVGIGAEGLAGLAPAARAVVENAEVLIGGKRHLAMVPDGGAERLAWASPLEDTFKLIAARRGRRVAVLATGDPMFYGVGATLARHFDDADMAILPHPGAFSLACARLNWAFADVETLSLHGRAPETLRLFMAPGARLLILAQNGDTPAQVAARLTEAGYGPSAITVLENMASNEERRTDGTAQAWDGPRAADLNTIAVECRAAPGANLTSLVPGLPDDAFEHSGQITKREVRAVTLAALAPLAGERLWDIGAGAGTVAIEWLRAVRHTQAHAIEQNPERAAMMARNAMALGVPHLDIITATAPGCLAGLKDLGRPNAVFIGGGLGEAGLVEAAWEALQPGGRLVANAVTLEGEAAQARAQAAHGGELRRIAISRAEPLGAKQGWRPLRPVSQWAAVKGPE